MSLNGKHALITGASRGIGRGIALKLAESGVTVAIHCYQNENAAKQTLEDIRKRLVGWGVGAHEQLPLESVAAN